MSDDGVIDAPFSSLPFPSPPLPPHPSLFLSSPSSSPSFPSGGDLSYHLEKEGRFQLPRVRLYLAEIALALEYLRERRIIHRDVKPANMLLDSQGHIHLTDFNVACIVRPDIPVTSTTGTKPYMGMGQRWHYTSHPHLHTTLPLHSLTRTHSPTAPEVLHPTSTGYTYAVDWWSLGVSAYEMLRGQVSEGCVLQGMLGALFVSIVSESWSLFPSATILYRSAHE